MSEMAEIWKVTKELRKQESTERKQANYDKSAALLKDRGIMFTANGFHLIVSHNGLKADFWPTTGKYNIRGDAEYKRGVFNLIKDLEKWA